jgi:hypothetical protein
MKARRHVLLVVALAVAAAGCGDGGPTLLNQSEDWLVQFKRVTLADDAPDRLEIEIVVRTGMHFSEPAADGTTVVIETSLGEFEGDGPRARTSTIGGHAVVRLIPPPGPTQVTVTARVDHTESRIDIQIDNHGSMRVSSS